MHNELIEKIDGMERHCEHGWPNSECPYLERGCLGCTFKHVVDTCGIPDEAKQEPCQK